MHNLHDKLIKVYDRVHAAASKTGRDPNTVQLLAVSKTQNADAVKEVYNAGQRAFGENYLQEALEKQTQLKDLDIEWHFIGPIQSNKTQEIAKHFDWVHSVDRAKIAQRLNDQRPDDLPPLNICLQVNIDNEASKSGVSPDDLVALAETVANLPRLRLRGLMAIPTASHDHQTQRDAFARVNLALQQLKKSLPEKNLTDQTIERPVIKDQTLDTLSMGMSGDLEAAIEEGATIVRIGTDIFGARL